MIILDQDPIFLGQFWLELFHQARAKLKYNTSYHSLTNGQMEFINQCFKTYLCCFVGSKPRQWPEWLAWAEFWFNTTFNGSTQVSPFQALYRRPPPILFKGETYPSKIP